MKQILKEGIGGIMGEGNWILSGHIHKQQKSLWIIKTAAWRIVKSTTLLAETDLKSTSLT